MNRGKTPHVDKARALAAQNRGMRAGIAHCVVSVSLNGGHLKIAGIRICKSRAEAEGLLLDAQNRENLMVEDIWIEEHLREDKA